MADFLHGVEIVEIADGLRPIRTVKSAVIGLVGSAPKGPVNTPTLIAGDRTKAAATFGSHALGVGTIPDALDAIFKQHGAAVVVVNVLDPSIDKTAVAERLYQLGTSGKVKLADAYAQTLVVKGPPPTSQRQVAGTDYNVNQGTGVITGVAWEAAADQITVEYTNAGTRYRETVEISSPGATSSAAALTHVTGGVDVHVVWMAATAGTGSSEPTLTAGTDYAYDGDKAELALVAGGALEAGEWVNVAYDRIDDSDTAVAASDIVGGTDAGTGAYTGISALLGARSAVGQTPKILVAPGYSHEKTVADALISVADRLRAVTPIEGPSTTDDAAAAYRDGFTSRRAYLVDPDVLVADPDGGSEPVEAPNSAYVAGVIAKSDAERGFWWSPSNRVILGILGTARPVDFALGDANARANLLNENEVATIIRERGYRLWGNRTCSSDRKWAFLSVVRTADILSDSLLRSHLWAVDRNITRTYFDDVSEGVNAYIRTLVGLGALLGGLCRPSPELNTQTTIAAGQAYFDIEFTPTPPAERVTFRSRLTNDYLDTLFDTEEDEDEAEEEAA